jgi:hypothetical protein
VNKQTVYDEQINPLVNQLIDICKDSGIGLFLTACIPTEEDPNLVCVTSVPSNAADLSKPCTDMPGDALIGHLRRTVFSLREVKLTHSEHLTARTPAQN